MSEQQSHSVIVDSALTFDEAAQSDPSGLKCPPHILKQQSLITVHYIGFDGLLHRGQILVHETATTDIHDLFTLAESIQFPFANVVPLAHPKYKWDRDRAVLQGNLTYAFNYCTVAGSERLSDHTHGLAIDINPKQNPCIRTLHGEKTVWPPTKWDPKQPGTLTLNHPLVEFMLERGWRWGGQKHNSPEGYIITDYMHFSKST